MTFKASDAALDGLPSSPPPFVKSTDLEMMNAIELRAELQRARGYCDSARLDVSSVDVASASDAPAMRAALRSLYRAIPEAALPPPAPEAPAWPAGVVVSDGVPLCSHCLADLREPGEAAVSTGKPRVAPPSSPVL